MFDVTGWDSLRFPMQPAFMSQVISLPYLPSIVSGIGYYGGNESSMKGENSNVLVTSEYTLSESIINPENLSP